MGSVGLTTTMWEADHLSLGNVIAGIQAIHHPNSAAFQSARDAFPPIRTFIFVSHPRPHTHTLYLDSAYTITHVAVVTRAARPGMSTYLRNDGSKSNIMTTTAAQTNSAINTLPDHDAAMSAKNGGGADMESGRKRKTDKKSMEYLIKSGLAGGFAGCAVRQGDHLSYLAIQTIACILTCLRTGQNRSRPPRPCKDPLPNP